MHARFILLAASVAFPILAAPAQSGNISPIPAVERRNQFSVGSLLRDVLKRHSTADEIPAEPSSSIIDELQLDLKEGEHDLVERGKSMNKGGRSVEDLEKRRKAMNKGGRSVEDLEKRRKAMNKGGRSVEDLEKRGKGMRKGGQGRDVAETME